MVMNKTPMYAVIEEALRQMIRERSPGDPLPSDSDLCERFGVSRMTARHAKQRLATEGLIYREPGVGTFVARPPIHRPVSQLLSFSEEMRNRGLEPSSRVLIAETRESNEEEAEGLRIEPGDTVVHIRRLRLGDDTPIAVQDAVLPADCAPVLDADLARGSLHDGLEEIGRRPIYARGRLSPEAADAVTAELLGLSVGSPLLVEHLIVFDDRDDPLEQATTRYAGGRYVFDFESAHTRRDLPLEGSQSVFAIGPSQSVPLSARDEPSPEVPTSMGPTSDTQIGTTLADHLVVCGWSSKGEELIKELRLLDTEWISPVVVVAPLSDDPTLADRAVFLSGDPTEVDVLARAGVPNARSVIILADKSSTTRTESDQDARTLLTAIAVKALNPGCYVCVEVIRPENRQVYAKAGIDEMLIDAEIVGRLLASVVSTDGVSLMASELIRRPAQTDLQVLPIPKAQVGKTLADAITDLRHREGLLPVAVRSEGGRFRMNPPLDLRLGPGTELLVIDSPGGEEPNETPD